MKRKLANREKSKETKKEKRPKVIIQGEIFEWTSNGGITDCENVDTTTIGEALDMLPENSKGEVINIYEESSCEEMDDNVPEKAILAKTSQH